MSEIRQNENITHELVLLERKRLAISGVVDVISFDECAVKLDTVCGELEIGGENLHVSLIDANKGAITLDGNVESVVYYDKDKTERKSLFKKLKS